MDSTTEPNNTPPTDPAISSAEKAQIVRDYCAHTTGSERIYMLPPGAFTPRGFAFTDGIQLVAETCGAWWLVDLVMSHQPHIAVRQERHGLSGFQVWRLFKPALERTRWMVDAWSDTPEHPGGDDGPPSVLLARQMIPFTDFPEELSPFSFYVENNTMLLKEER